MSYIPQPGDKFIRCDCCGREIVAVLSGDQIHIVKRVHGRQHRATVPLRSAELFDSGVSSVEIR